MIAGFRKKFQFSYQDTADSPGNFLILARPRDENTRESDPKMNFIPEALK